MTDTELEVVIDISSVVLNESVLSSMYVTIVIISE